MIMSNSQQSFYEKYWIERGQEFSGDRTGYAPNLRRWMSENLSQLNPEDRILEIGCGDASFTKDLARFSKKVTAIDISSQQLALNREKYPETEFIAHDLAEPLPFSSDRFRAIWCSEVLEHLFDPAFALREMQRVLEPGGFVLVTVPYHGFFKNICIALFKWDHHFNPEYPHIRFFTRNTLQTLCEKAGFASITTTTCGMSRPLRDLLIPTNLLLRATKLQ